MAAKKTPKKKATSKKSPAKKASKAKESAAKADSGSVDENTTQPAAFERLKGKRKETPAVFKVKAKKPAVIAFTPEDALKILKTRKEEAAKAAPKKKPAAKKKKAAKKAPKVEPKIEVPAEKRSFQSASLADILGFNPAAAKPKPSNEDDPRVAAKFKKWYKLLLRMRNELKEGIHYHTEETLRRSSRDDSGDLSGYGQHQADAGTETFDRDLALSLVSSEQEALIEIEEAIQRIYNGTYGVCEMTGEEIATERLEAVPFARHSVEGQAQYERTNRRKIDRGNVFMDEDEDAPRLASDEDDE